MAKKRKQAAKGEKASGLDPQMAARLREGALILSVGVAIFLIIALVSYYKKDTSWSQATMMQQTASNRAGWLGGLFASSLFELFGLVAYLFPCGFIYLAWRLFKRARGHIVDTERDYRMAALRLAGFAVIIISTCALLHIKYMPSGQDVALLPGGLLGAMAGSGLMAMLNRLGACIFLVALFLVGVTVFTGLSWLNVLEWLGQKTLQGLRYLRQAGQGLKSLIGDFRAQRLALATEMAQAEPTPRPSRIEPSLNSASQAAAAPKPQTPPASTTRIEPKIASIKPSKRAIKSKQMTLFVKGAEQELSLNLLDEAKPQIHTGYSREELEKMSRDVEIHLRDFGVEANVVAVHPGPVITRFELQLAPGVKVSKISGLSKDLARSLSVISVRIVDVIPGKSVVGLELPNNEREIVRLREILSSETYEQSHSPLTLALGKDIAGRPVVADLARMPHLLVAGTTGAGKSVCINAMLLSLLYKSTPEDVRLILVDPKMLELAIYEDIPHLLAPVVTDMKEAANALRWCVAEMERRYRLMAAVGVRNLAGLNQKISECQKAGEPLLDPLHVDPSTEAAELQKVPYIVVIIDEFADMMMVVGKKVEQLIARIAQKARAAGIHMILATQRPSVDVITGLIKANVPARIAFNVSSKIDSRTILDQQGAEQLLGQGDMLYLPSGKSVPERVHGAFVADQEVHNVVAELKRFAKPEYLDNILDGGADTEAGGDGGEYLIPGIDTPSGGEGDPLYDEAVQIVIDTRRASISGIQRRLKIGYNRAARLVEDMEKAGVVSPMESNGTREVLVPKRD